MPSTGTNGASTMLLSAGALLVLGMGGVLVAPRRMVGHG